MLCDCGAYHSPGEEIMPRASGTYSFSQSLDQKKAGDPPCDIVVLHMLHDDAVECVICGTQWIECVENQLP